MQAQIVNLLQDLQRDLGLSLIVISHDLSVVEHIADRIMVIYLGRVMEHGAARDIVRVPRHPYTRALIASAPVPDPAIERGRRTTVLEGELPSPLAPPSGCVFRSRCPSRATFAPTRPRQCANSTTTISRRVRTERVDASGAANSRETAARGALPVQKFRETTAEPGAMSEAIAKDDCGLPPALGHPRIVSYSWTTL